MIALLKSWLSFVRLWRWSTTGKGEGPAPIIVDEERRALLKFMVVAAPTIGLLRGVTIEDLSKALPGPKAGPDSIGPRTDFAGPRIYAGAGSPEDALKAPRGSLFLRSDVTAFYRNVDGETTWVLI